MIETKSKKRKILTTATAIILAVSMLIGGTTYAYLQANTKDVVNNFKTNQVTVDLEESTDGQYNIIPGTSEFKDPTVTVNTTVPAYIYVEITDNTDGLVTYTIENGWMQLEYFDNIYYREIDSSTAEQSFAVLKDNTVSYDSALVNSDMLVQNEDGSYSLKEGITLSFNASAIQKEPFANALLAYMALTNKTVEPKTLNTTLSNKDIDSDNEYIYSGGRNCVAKYDINTGELTKAYTFKTNSDQTPYDFTGVKINGDYIYACSRQNLAGEASNENNETLGDLYVFDKELNLISKTDLKAKGARIFTYENIMIVAKQLYGFNIYDISTPSEPHLMYEYAPNTYEEFQGGQIIERNGSLYYVVGDFGFAVLIFDITDTVNSYGAADAKLVGTFKFNQFAELKNNVHTYDLIVDYPTIYATVATVTESNFGAENDYRGIITLNFDEIIDKTASGKLKEISYTITQIPDEYLEKINTLGDTRPTRMTKYGNYLITNCSESGLAVFKINGDKVSFDKMISFGNSTADISHVLPVIATNDKLIAGTISGTQDNTIFVYDNLDLLLP